MIRPSSLPPASDKDPLDFALSLLHRGRIREAVPHLEKLSRTQAREPLVHYNLGIAYSELGQYDEALIRLKRATRLAADMTSAWVGIGVAYLRMDKPERALESLQHAVELDPGDGYARRNLGAALLSLHRPAEALAQMREACKALPDDPQTLCGLATALHRAGGKEQLAEADALYGMVVERWPEHPAAELARTSRTELAHKTLRERVGGQLRLDVLSYMVAALETFAKVGTAQRKKIVLEIALKGREGLTIHNPDNTYTLESLPGTFTGLHLVSILYVGVKADNPDADAGIDLSNEYRAALSMARDQPPAGPAAPTVQL